MRGVEKSLMRNQGDSLETCIGRGEVDMVGRNIMYLERNQLLLRT